MTATPARVPIPPNDQVWLHMDRPNNLMYIQTVFWFRSTPSWDRVREVIQERMLDRYPVYRRRPVQDKGRWYWQDDEDFAMERHVTHWRLPEGSTMDDIRVHVSDRLSQPLRWDRPLWEVELIEGVGGIEGSRGDEGAVIFWRFHHAIADGIRLIQMILTLTDHEDGVSSSPRVGDRFGPGGPLDMVEHVLAAEARGAFDLMGGAAREAAHPRSTVFRLAGGIRRGVTQPRHLPSRMIEAVSGLSAEDNSAVNTARGLARLLLEPSAPALDWKGRPGVDKHVAWVDQIDMGEIKSVARAVGGTMNDVMLTAVSLGVTAYLREEGHEVILDAVNWLVPVSLQVLDEDLPEDLGNHFTLVMLRMPIGIDDPLDALKAVRSSMNRAKHSAEAEILFGAQNTLSRVPQPVPRLITNFIANKAVGQLTNVPGPQVAVSLAGTEVGGFLGWVPESGDQPLGVCIFSYNGSVSIGVSGDKVLVPNPQRIADLVKEQFAELVDAV